MNRELAIIQYENHILYGKRYTLSGTKQDKKDAVLAIIKYVISDVLCWTPDVAVKSFTWDIACQMHLDYLIDTYLECPQDIDKHVDLDYIIYITFPDDVYYDPEEKVIRTYRKVLTGELNRFPKNFFSGENGPYKAAILLLYVIGRFMRVEEGDIEALYDAFANTAAMNQKFKQWKIGSVCQNLYQTPLDYLHRSLPSDQANNMMYANCLYNNIRQMYLTKKSVNDTH